MPMGSKLKTTLPDGTEVWQNAGTTIKYPAHFTKNNRQVILTGEAYFEVTKGNKFRVESANGTTVVLGTSFNIYSRRDEYRVSCFTGSVRVISPTNLEVVLSPQYKATIEADGQITVSRENNGPAANSWINGMFSFKARPLRLVFDEIERQYGVDIVLQGEGNYLYTGYFSRNKPVEEVLELVCKPFGLTFARNSEKSFEVYQN